MTIVLGEITLPEDLEWTDEFDWCPVEDSIDTALSGSLVIHSGTRPKGRPITLAGSDDSAAPITREDLEKIKALADVPQSGLVLDYHGRSFNVRFRYSEKPYSAKPVLYNYESRENGGLYTVTIRLMEI